VIIGAAAAAATVTLVAAIRRVLRRAGLLAR
jgi:hypothetical protein